MDSYKIGEKQDKKHHSLTRLYESIYFQGNLDSFNLDSNDIDQPLALFQKDNFRLIASNNLFQEKFSPSLSPSYLQDYIKPYSVREILSFSQGSCFLFKPLHTHNFFSDSFNTCCLHEFELYNLFVNIVTWKSDQVIAVIFHPLSQHSIVNCTTRLSQLSSLINNLPVVVYQCRNDKQWTMEYISSNCWQLTGYEDQSLINNNSHSYSSLIHPLDRTLIKEELESAIASRTEFNIEYRIIDAKNNLKWVWEKGQGIYAPTGELLYLVGIIQEITKKRKDEAEKSLLFNMMEQRIPHSS